MLAQSFNSGLAGGVGLVLVLLSPTDYNLPAGRWGGYLWSAASRLPVFSGHLRPVPRPHAALGAALLAVMTRRLAHQAGAGVAWLWLGMSFLAWVATTLSNRLVFHRYFEPTILIFLIFWILLMVRGVTIQPVFRPDPIVCSSRSGRDSSP